MKILLIISILILGVLALCQFAEGDIKSQPKAGMSVSIPVRVTVIDPIK